MEPVRFLQAKAIIQGDVFATGDDSKDAEVWMEAALSKYFARTAGFDSYGRKRDCLAFARCLLRQAWLWAFFFLTRST